MRISDWSSDVCSSDLIHRPAQQVHVAILALTAQPTKPDRQRRAALGQAFQRLLHLIAVAEWGQTFAARMQLGERLWATDRKSVGEGKSVSVRVDRGGRRIIKKKNTLELLIQFITIK